MLVLSLVSTSLGFAADYPGNCGSLCVYVAALSEGAELPPYEEFVRLHSWTREPLCSLDDQLQSLQSLGIDARLIEWTPQTPPTNFSKLIVHQDIEHFVILKKSDGPTGATVFDPPRSERTLLQKDWVTFSGIGIEFGSPRADSDATNQLWRTMLVVGSIGLLVLAIYRIRHRAITRRVVRPTRNGAVAASVVITIGLVVVVVLGGLGCSSEQPLERDRERAFSDEKQVSFAPHGSEHPKFEKEVYCLGQIRVSDEPYVLKVRLLGVGLNSGIMVEQLSTSCGCMSAEVTSVGVDQIEAKLVFSRSSAGQNSVNVAARLSGLSEIVRATVTYDAATELEAFAVPVHHVVSSDCTNITSHILIESESEIPEGLRFQCKLNSAQQSAGVSIKQIWHSSSNCEVQIDTGAISGFQVVHLMLTSPAGATLHQQIPISWESPNLLSVQPSQFAFERSPGTLRLLVQVDDEHLDSSQFNVQLDGKEIEDLSWHRIGDGSYRLLTPIRRLANPCLFKSCRLTVSSNIGSVNVPITVLEGDGCETQ